MIVWIKVTEVVPLPGWCGRQPTTRPCWPCSPSASGTPTNLPSTFVRGSRLTLINIFMLVELWPYFMILKFLNLNFISERNKKSASIPSSRPGDSLTLIFCRQFFSGSISFPRCAMFPKLTCLLFRFLPNMNLLKKLIKENYVGQVTLCDIRLESAFFTLLWMKCRMSICCKIFQGPIVENNGTVNYLTFFKCVILSICL